jgi:hypothetical protein
MDREIRKITQPDYRRIYSDIIQKKYPEKEKEARPLLNKKRLSVLDLIRLNTIIFSKTENLNLKFRSYDKETIAKILNYQKIHNLNDTQLANHFKLSRNTVNRWKKMLF